MSTLPLWRARIKLNLHVSRVPWNSSVLGGLLYSSYANTLSSFCWYLSLVRYFLGYQLSLRFSVNANRSCFSNSRHNVVLGGFDLLPFWISLGVLGLAIACPCSKKGLDPAVVKQLNSTHFTLPSFVLRKFTSADMVHYHLSTSDTLWSALICNRVSCG